MNIVHLQEYDAKDRVTKPDLSKETSLCRSNTQVQLQDFKENHWRNDHLRLNFLVKHSVIDNQGEFYNSIETN